MKKLFLVLLVMVAAVGLANAQCAKSQAGGAGCCAKKAQTEVGTQGVTTTTVAGSVETTATPSTGACSKAKAGGAGCCAKKAQAEAGTQGVTTTTVAGSVEEAEGKKCMGQATNGAACPKKGGAGCCAKKAQTQENHH